MCLIYNSELKLYKVCGVNNLHAGLNKNYLVLLISNLLFSNVLKAILLSDFFFKYGNQMK